jgi:tetratricopeptide (TPR) repeat protein
VQEQPGLGEIPSGHSGNEIESARIQGDIVQAHDVFGGIHFHGVEDNPHGPGVVPRQLPADVSAFVNRKPELRALSRLADPQAKTSAARTRRPPASVVVITGSAGVGKTALALHWAHRIRHRFPDGEIYANLRGYDESPPTGAEIVLDRILRDLGIQPSQIPQDLDGRAALLRSLIAGRSVLMVLDNVADASQVRSLIPGGAGPLLVITSRNQLPGLAVRDGAQRVQLDILREPDAVALLREVTRTGARKDSPEDLAELARLCARLPLALRIAAERAASRPMMRLTELIADLRDDSMLWDALSLGGGPDGDGVRSVFAWSYRDLPDDAARMFRALGLHPGPDISLQAAAAAAGVPAQTARRSLDILLGAFLIESVRPGRYQLHDLLRAYALDQARTLDTDSERAETLDRVLRWYIAAASQASFALSPGDRFDVDIAPVEGPEPLRFDDATLAFEWFDTERPNLVASARSAAEEGLPRRAWELAMVLSPIHMQHFAFDDWSELSAIAVSAAEEIHDPKALSSALDNRGKFLFRRRHLGDANAAHARALSMRREIGDQRGVCESLNALGLIGLRTRELEEASRYFEETAVSARRIGNSQWEGLGRMNWAEALLAAGNAAPALELIAPMPAFFAGLEDPAYEGNALWLLSWAQRLLGNIPAAGAAIDAALHIAETASNRMWEGFWLIEAARVRLADGDPAEAMRCCRMAASLQRQIGDASREATALDCAGEALAAAGNPREAAAFHLEAARMHQRLGDGWQEATALAHLSGCERALGDDDASRGHLRQALALIEPFADDQATRLRDALEARLA